MNIKIEDVNDNAPNLTQIVIYPDQNIKVSEEISESFVNWDDISIIQEDKNYTLNRVNKQRLPLFYIPENVTLGATILRLVAQDKDQDKNAEIMFDIISEFCLDSKSELNKKRFFAIGSRSGEISVIQHLPAETDIQLLVIAKDGGNLMDNITLRLHVTDVNDHPPLFPQSLYLFELNEGVYHNYKVGTIMAFDFDFGKNGNITYELVVPDAIQNMTFKIGKYTGDFFVSGLFDRETKNTYNLDVKASDQGTVKLNSSTGVEIKILDINDNAPMFYGYNEIGKLYIPIDNVSRHRDITGKLVPIYHASVIRNISIGSSVIKIFANDSDYIANGNGLVSFDLVDIIGKTRYFTIDSKKGLITTIASLKYEPLNLHYLKIIASDLGTPNLSAAALLLVHVTNFRRNEEIEAENYVHKPTFRHYRHELEVEENSNVPLKLIKIDTFNNILNYPLHYSIDLDKTKSSEYFMVDSKNGTLYLIKPFDREQKDLYEVTVQVAILKNTGDIPVIIHTVAEEKLNESDFIEIKVVVKVKDINDNAPQFKVYGRSLFAVVPNEVDFGYDILKVEVCF